MTILVQLLQIITLKRRPSEISYDPGAATLAFVAATAIAYAQLAISKQITDPLPFVITQNMAQAGIFWVILKVHSKEVRYIQAATVLFGASAILQFGVLLFIQLPALFIVGLILSGWNFYLLSLVLSNSIDIGIGRALLITFGYHIAIGFLLRPLFPEQYQQIQNAITTMSAS